MIFNMNAKASVVLTEYGLAHLNKYWRTFGIFRRTITDKSYAAPLWEIMQVFGEVLYNGNPNVPFENNEIKIEK